MLDPQPHELSLLGHVVRGLSMYTLGAGRARGIVFDGSFGTDPSEDQKTPTVSHRRRRGEDENVIRDWIHTRRR